MLKMGDRVIVIKKDTRLLRHRYLPNNGTKLIIIGTRGGRKPHTYLVRRRDFKSCQVPFLIDPEFLERRR